jgi:hypothetical protein
VVAGRSVGAAVGVAVGVLPACWCAAGADADGCGGLGERDEVAAGEDVVGEEVAPPAGDDEP